jgi:hypothetical protein
MPGGSFIGSKGERGGQSLVGHRQRWWHTIMVAEASVSGGDRLGVVVGSDEGGCSDRYRSGRGARRWRAHAPEVATAAAAVGPGRKMTGQGP